jgi:DNA-binding NarL/FixJ family response regulator
MALKLVAKLSLVPVAPVARLARTSAADVANSVAPPDSVTGAEEALSVPLSQTRVSPRALAERVEHHAVVSTTRLTRSALLTGDWQVVDVYRRGTELRALMRAGAMLVSGREQEVLDAVLNGMPDRDLSRRLGITRQCVCGHLGNALGKLGADSRFAALQAWRALAEAEKGRAGRAQLAEVEYGSDTLLSLVVPIPPRPEIEARLSSAETHVAWLVCDGLSNRDIAVERGTAERTVANQVASIFTKLGVSRRFDVAQFLLGLR